MRLARTTLQSVICDIHTEVICLYCSIASMLIQSTVMNCIILKSTTVSQSYTTVSLQLGHGGRGAQIFNGPYLNFQVSVASAWQVLLL